MKKMNFGFKYNGINLMFDTIKEEIRKNIKLGKSNLLIKDYEKVHFYMLRRYTDRIRKRIADKRYYESFDRNTLNKRYKVI